MITYSHDSIAGALTDLRTELLHYNANVTLIAVSKQQPVEKILQAIAAGQRVFGENRVQEAKQKWPELKRQFPDIELHLIGPLQTNKIREVLALFDVIETVDSYRLAEMLASEMERSGKRPACYIQINTGNEPQKSGIPCEEAEEFITHCITVLGLPIVGLMCIPPAEEDPAPHFRLLQQWAEHYRLLALSMGMSNDYSTAISQGATHVRLGRAIFGERG